MLTISFSYNLAWFCLFKNVSRFLPKFELRFEKCRDPNVFTDASSRSKMIKERILEEASPLQIIDE